jgi:hypothetical protein
MLFFLSLEVRRFVLKSYRVCQRFSANGEEAELSRHFLVYFSHQLYLNVWKVNLLNLPFYAAVKIFSTCALNAGLSIPFPPFCVSRLANGFLTTCSANGPV